MLALLLVATVASRADSAPDPTCDQAIAVWKRLHRAAELAAIKASADDRKRIDEQVDANAKDLTAACRTFAWPVTYRRCLAGATKPDALERCFRAEYDRGNNRERCEAVLDHYMTLADTDFAEIFADHDAAWIDDFKRQHRDSMRPWCMERGLVGDAGGSCARAAKTREMFMACGKAE